MIIMSLMFIAGAIMQTKVGEKILNYLEAKVDM